MDTSRSILQRNLYQMERLFGKKSAQMKQYVHGFLSATLNVIFTSRFSFTHRASQSY